MVEGGLRAGCTDALGCMLYGLLWIFQDGRAYVSHSGWPEPRPLCIGDGCGDRRRQEPLADQDSFTFLQDRSVWKRSGHLPGEDRSRLVSGVGPTGLFSSTGERARAPVQTTRRTVPHERVFISKVRSALAVLGYDEAAYAGHSFRIGAATTAAERGIEDSLIKMMGRWESSAYQLYVRASHQSLASMSRRLVVS